LAVVVAAALAAGLPSVTNAAPPADPVARALSTPVNAAWTGRTLRTAAARLGELGGCAVVVDRRLDPDTPITLDVADEPLADVLAAVADAAGGEVVTYAGHVRVVPRGRAGELCAADAARAAELKALPAATRGRLRAGAAASWSDGAVPRDLVAQAATEGGFLLTDLSSLPHDHFPAATLPLLGLADRIDLLLAHFDRRVEWRSLPAGGGDGGYAVVAIAPPDTTVGAGVTDADRPPPKRTARPRPPSDAAATYTLTVAAPLDELLATLARRLGLALELDVASLRRRGVAPGEIVRLEVRDASRDQLLDAILGPRGLLWRIDGRTLAVSAAPP